MAERTKEELDAYYNAHPGKRIGACVLVFDQKGRLLILKPSYKPGWSLVGGLTDADESPLDAACRETREEIGLDIPPQRLEFFGYRYVEARNGRNEDSQLLFRTTITDAEAGRIVLQESEVADSAFVKPEALADYADTPRMQAVLAMLEAGYYPVYIHNEQVVPTAEGRKRSD
jgi:8-oxo-dGTP diphosphatase